MQIVPYQPAHLPGLYEVYRQTTANVPHCRFIPSLKYTGLALARAEQAGAGLLVAEDHGAVRGVATLRPVAPAADGVPQLEITGLFAPEERTATVLLEACLSRAKGARRLVAFPAEHGHCPMPAYNAGWDGLSDKMPSVARVLARHGFAPTYRELHLECAAPHFPPTPMPAPPGITMVEGTEDGYLAVRAMAGDQEAGICLFMMLSKYSDHPEADAWGYVDWLHVAEAQRRRGLGRYLMTWTLRRLREQGCRGCWLTTGANNWPAQPLYLSLGFEILDTSSSWEKMHIGDVVL
jgi:ribosomal protein S18 acetylase RimI-like enzyme